MPNRIGLLMESLFLFNIAGPNLYITPLGSHDSPSNPEFPDDLIIDFAFSQVTYSFATYVPSSLLYANLPAYLGWFVWLELLVLGIIRIIRKRLYLDQAVMAIAFCLFFNFYFHLFWGLDLSLYTAHWTFLVVILAAYGIGNGKYDRLLHSIVFVLIVLLSWNNTILISRLGVIFTQE